MILYPDDLDEERYQAEESYLEMETSFHHR